MRAARLPIRYERKVLSERVRLLYAQSIPGLIATVLTATLLVAALWTEVDHHFLIAWFLAMLSATVVRLALVLAYRSATDRVDRAERWLRRFAAGAVVTGALWGVAGVVLFPDDSMLHQVFLLLVLAGMSAAAVPFLSSVFAVYVGYALPMLVPLAATLWLQPDVVYGYISAMTLIYLLMLLTSARSIATYFAEATDLRFERAALADQLAEANAQLSEEAEQRRRIQDNLEESYYFLQRIMDSANDAIVVLSAKGRLERANPAMAGLAGRSPDALHNAELPALFSGDSRAAFDRVLGEAASTGEPRLAENLELQRPDGTRRTISISMAPVLDPGSGAVQALVGIISDVTERRNVERLKDEFVAAVSHELRTPLTSIRGALGLVGRMEEEPVPEAVRSLLEIADRNSERLLQLIDDLLDLQGLDSARARFRLAVFPVAALVEYGAAVNRTFAQHHSVHIEVVEPLSAASVYVDRERVVQVLTHLLSNAVRHSPKDAGVKMATEEREDFVRVIVRNTGPGSHRSFVRGYSSASPHPTIAASDSRPVAAWG